MNTLLVRDMATYIRALGVDTFVARLEAGSMPMESAAFEVVRRALHVDQFIPTQDTTQRLATALDRYCNAGPVFQRTMRTNMLGLLHQSQQDVAHALETLPEDISAQTLEPPTGITGFWRGVTGYLSASLKERKPEETGLAQLFWTLPLAPSQQQIEYLDGLLTEIESTPLGSNFGMSPKTFQFLQTLRATRLGASDKRHIMATLNQKAQEQKGRTIDINFMNEIERIKKRAEAVAFKLDALGESNIEFTGPYFSSFRIAVFNQHGEPTKAIWEKTELVLEKCFTKREEPTESDIAVLNEYVDAYVSGRMPVTAWLAKSLELLHKYDQVHGTNHYASRAPALMSCAIDHIEASQHTPKTYLAHEHNKRQQAIVAASIISRALDNRSQVAEVTKVFLDRSRCEQTFGFLLAFAEIYKNIDSLSVTYVGHKAIYPEKGFVALKRHFEAIIASNGLNPEEKAEAVENLYLAFMSVSIDKAIRSEQGLSQGRGFYHAQSLNASVVEAAVASRIFAQLELPKSKTQHVDFEALRLIFLGLRYNRQGEKVLGTAISAHEAFGIRGKTRKFTADVYTPIKIYLMTPPDQATAPEMNILLRMAREHQGDIEGFEI